MSIQQGSASLTTSKALGPCTNDRGAFAQRIRRIVHELQAAEERDLRGEAEPDDLLTQLIILVGSILVKGAVKHLVYPEGCVLKDMKLRAW